MSRTYWHRAARAMSYYIHELQDTESALSSEVLECGARARHWESVAGDTRDALNEAQAYICALEQDRETDRVASYKRAVAHCESRAADQGGFLEAADTALPVIDASGIDLRTVWFRHRREALQYAANAGFRQTPERRRVWLDLAWREEWSLRVPIHDAAHTDNQAAR